MVTAAKTFSQVVTHMSIAFTVTWAMTGSAALGGVAALLEPLVNVALLPLHEHGWKRLRAAIAALQDNARTALLAERLSQTALHTVVAFGVMYAASGSLALGGMAALLEPVINVLVLPYHDRAWERLRARKARTPAQLQPA
ncbi:DUF2061 domain-containing protein [Massilia soli]|uniref:DUF2061 domain-containing protein n=1 Tax=Massilia soli TaxID=2792854 RepID=A0ABS7SN86_9BURK|nr:DUF2061 domain-containing protein [Massilia soli]MBZ2207656.1 DUF2061 domain-containing protein [Massilia soli]